MQMEGKLVYPQGVRKTAELQPDGINKCLSITYIQRVLKSLKDIERLESDNLNMCSSDSTHTHILFLKHKLFVYIYK